MLSVCKEPTCSMAELEMHVLLCKDRHAFSYTGIVKNKIIPTAFESFPC